MEDEDFNYNTRGAKAYRNPLRHEILDIPRLSSRKEKGALYEVLLVGRFSNPIIPTVTIRKMEIPHYTDCQINI